ncbi:MAG TPA: hypothetical protein VIV54_17125 [Burkholderiales bacterium]
MTDSKTPMALAIAILSIGCTTIEYGYVGVQPLENNLGHVIGHKEILRDAHTGEEVERVTYYAPRIDANGNVVGYEEQADSGMILRDLNGRRVGLRYIDLRSRDTNPRGDVTITVTP